MKTIARALSALLLVTAALTAQADFQKDETELGKKVAAELLRFARVAEQNKVGPRAKQAYDLVLDHYDLDNQAARAALGFKKVGAKWEPLPPDKQPKWPDTAAFEPRFKVVDDWYRTAVKLGALHRELGLKLQKAEALARAAFHLERAVFFNPTDKDAHLALGHQDGGGGFYGTAEQVAFVQRMKELERKALEVARVDHNPQPLPDNELPEEFKRLNLEFHGAKSAHFVVWARGAQEYATNAANWGERALDFMQFVLGNDMAKRLAVVPRASVFRWIGYLWTEKERDDFLKANPEVYAGKSLDSMKVFENIAWDTKQGPVNIAVKLMPPQMYDDVIVHAWTYGLDLEFNKALAEGMNHAATWFLLSTSITKHGALPDGTVGKKEQRLPESTSWWLRHIRDLATAGTDWAINQVPREKLSHFRNDVRIKSWSFITWLWARYPDKWLAFVSKVPQGEKIEFPEHVDQLAEEVFGQKLAQIEAEWREWSRGDSGVAAATGYGPPLLPERPNKEEVASLERMNQVRSQAIAYTVTGTDFREGKLGPLPPCELDAETSMACDEHAKYLCKWPKEHLKWPEAHEENPALEGFSPRGMRAGMRSVIIWTTGNPGVEFARDSVDGWMGTVYHRFPLLEHNIRRFGFSYVTDNGYSIGVLDMGSLVEPYDPQQAPTFVAWPPPGMKDVPLRFHGIEHPNPLDDQPEADRDITKTGYPVSLQLQREFAAQLTEASIALYLAKDREKAPAKYVFGLGEKTPWESRRGDSVSTWDHTPAAPLLKRLEEKQVVFAIPKQHLKPKTLYQVVVLLKTGTAQLQFCWEFTTGSHEEGLRLGK